MLRLARPEEAGSRPERNRPVRPIPARVAVGLVSVFGGGERLHDRGGSSTHRVVAGVFALAKRIWTRTRGRPRRGGASVRQEREPEPEVWAAFGVDAAQVAGWKALGFDPFEAALAQGDGFTPGIALHYRRQLRSTADRWRRADMDSPEGLRWHRAGFGAKEATRWRSLGVDVEAARSQRAGYRTSGVGAAHEQSRGTN